MACIRKRCGPVVGPRSSRRRPAAPSARGREGHCPREHELARRSPISSALSMKFPPRRVLVVDPIYHVHSVVHYRSALESFGFESTEFTVLTSVVSAQEAERVETFQRSQPRLQIRFLK